MSTILANAASLIIGFFLYLFFYWRALKDDYKSEQIFSSGIIIFCATVLTGLSLQLSTKWIPNSFVYDKNGFWFWGGTLGYLVSYFITSRRNTFKKLEQFQASSIPLFILMFLFFILDFVIKQNILSLYASGFVIFLVAIFMFWERNYRKYTWYKSGKFGFSALMTLGIFFLVRVLIALNSLNVLSSAGRVDVILSGVVSFLLFYGVYILSEK